MSKETYIHQKRPTKETWTYVWHICGTSGMFVQSNESIQMSKEIYSCQRDPQKRPTKETWTVKYDTSADVYTSCMFAQSIESIHMSKETYICQNELSKRPTYIHDTCVAPLACPCRRHTCQKRPIYVKRDLLKRLIYVCDTWATLEACPRTRKGKDGDGLHTHVKREQHTSKTTYEMDLNITQVCTSGINTHA